MLNHQHQHQHQLNGAMPAVSTAPLPPPPLQSHQYPQQPQPQQFTSSYAYTPQQQQQHLHAHHQQPQQQQQPAHIPSDSLRPTLDTSSYYAPPHLQSYAPLSSSHGYYDPLAPSSSAALHYALAPTMSHKRKSPGAASATSTASASASPSFAYAHHDKLCDVCYHPDPVLFAAACGHLFHSRCVHVWPLDQCPVCDGPMPHVSILRIDMNTQIETRSGKWTRPEEKFIDCILAEFDRSSLPLANGTPVRLVLAKLLNCSTMRLSKKFQKNALGKRTFRISKPTKGECALAFDRSDHVARQKELSRLEAIFRHELVEQFRRENNTDDGAYVETYDLRHAVKQFWVTCFVKLAVVIGQPVTGLDVSDSKKKKHALVLIRNGQYDDLLGWNESPANTPTVAPLPWHATNGLSAAGSGVYSTQQQQQPLQVQQMHMQQPVKKMRTPESMARSSMHDSDGAHFDAQQHVAPPSIAVATAYAYGKTSPRGYSPAAAADLHQQQQPQPHYYAQPSSGYARSAATTPTGEYATYAVKTEKTEPLHYSQLGALPAAATAAASYSGNVSGSYRPSVLLQQTGPATGGGSYQSSSESSGVTHQHATQSQSQQQATPQQQSQQAPATYPWDELLEAIPEPNQQAVDPALQAWTNLHIM